MAALVTGGMVGGGIYVALGVVVDAAGRWAWLGFVIAGFVAVSTAHAYGALSNHFETGGGAFAFLEQIDRREWAGSLSWILIVAYVLTLGLYAFAFGEYVAHAIGLGGIGTRILSLVVTAVLTGLNLMGAGTLMRVEITIVAANLVALIALGVSGLVDFDPNRLIPSSGPKPVWASLLGAAAIFVSYEGFQLLTYEYDDLEKPKRTLVPVLVWSSTAVVAIYILVTLGATSIIGGDAAVERASVALAVAGEDRFGLAGLVVITVAAAFATSAAINSTLFSTARLTRRVADDGELPAWFDQRNSQGVPGRAVVAIAALAGLLAVVGSLSSLVEAASLAFLTAFACVDLLAVRRNIGRRWLIVSGMAVGAVVGASLLYRLVTGRPIALGIMLILMLAAVFGRPWLLRRVDTEPAAD